MSAKMGGKHKTCCRYREKIGDYENRCCHVSKEGALKEFLKPLSFRIAPILGSGKQRMSWLHVDDITRAYLHAIKTNL